MLCNYLFPSLCTHSYMFLHWTNHNSQWLYCKNMHYAYDTCNIFLGGLIGKNLKGTKMSSLYHHKPDLITPLIPYMLLGKRNGWFNACWRTWKSIKPDEGFRWNKMVKMTIFPVVQPTGYLLLCSKLYD